MPDLFDWTFGRSDLWGDDGYSFAVAEDGDEIIAILGGIPFRFNDHGRSGRGLWFANWMIRPDRRGQPIGLQLLNFFLARGFDLYVSFGISDAVEPIYRVLRWQVPGDIPRLVAVLPEARDQAADLVAQCYPDWPAGRGATLAGRFAARLPEPPAGWIAAVPDDWDDRGWGHLAGGMVGAARDRAYLDWRYLKHPRFDYRPIVIPDGDRLGLLVWRLETIRLGDHGPVRFGRLVEFLPSSAGNARTLAGALAADLRAAGAIGADWYGYHGRIGGWLVEAGFVPVGTDGDGPLFPSRLQPPAGGPGTIRSAIRFGGTMPAFPLDAACDWYWTRSDSDQDRPNAPA